MKLTNVEIKSTDSPLLHVNAEFVTMRDAYSVGRYLGELVKRNVDVEILHKSANCCKPTTQPAMPVPEKIFRCGNATTVIWKDGTKTTVKLMPGADDSDYGAFTAALDKKIYGGNSKVMKYAGMVQRVKSKAEKKAERKAKHKAESESSGEKKYIVSQYGEISECNNLDGLAKTIIYAESKEDARKKAYSYFARSMKVYVVQSNGNAHVDGAYLADDFGKWYPSIGFKGVFWIPVFALSKEEALKVLAINPAPKEGDKP